MTIEFIKGAGTDTEELVSIQIDRIGIGKAMQLEKALEKVNVSLTDGEAFEKKPFSTMYTMVKTTIETLTVHKKVTDDELDTIENVMDIVTGLSELTAGSLGVAKTDEDTSNQGLA